MTPAIRIHPFEKRFIPDILRCLHEAYGKDYYRRECYDPEYLIQSNSDESLRLFLTITGEDQFAGMIGIRKNSYFEGSYEMSMQVMKPEFRGKGLGKQLLGYAICQSKKWGAMSVYGRSVTFHPISQNEMHLFSMQGTGMWFGRHKSGQTFLQSLSHPPTAHKLHSLVMAKPCMEIPQLILYPPRAFHAVVRSVYRSLGISVHFGNETLPQTASRTILFREDDDTSDNCDLYIMQAGLDFLNRLRREMASYHICPLQTYNAFINIKDPACGFACRILEQNSFFLTGLHPLNRNAEYLIFHRLPDPDIRFDELVLSSENRPLLTIVEEEYRKKELNFIEEKKGDTL